MAMGLNTSNTGGVMATPAVPGLGEDQWALMSGISPANPLITGAIGSVGYGQTRIATLPNPQAGLAARPPRLGDLLNLRHNPLSWVLLATILYWLMHQHEHEHHHDRRR